MLQWHVDSWGVGTFERVNDGLLEQAAVDDDDDDDDGDEDTFWKISVRSSNTAGQDMLKMWRRVCRCKRIKEMKEKEEEEEEEEESPVIAPVPITKQWREEVRPFLELRR